MAAWRAAGVSGRGRAFSWAFAGLLAGLPIGGCVEGHQALLTPIWGCGLEGANLMTVRIRARGDLPAAQADSVLLDGGKTSLENLPDGVDAITVEGLFGESDVLAVGRTPRLPLDGTQGVYFSPPDQLCPVESPLQPRDRVALAVASSGVILGVGGVGFNGSLLDEIVVLRDDNDEVLIPDERLPGSVVGHTLAPIGDHEFVLIGGTGAGSSTPSADATRIDVDPGSLQVRVHEPQSVTLDGSPITARAYHGAVALPDGRVLVQGGCAEVERGQCVPSEASVLRSGFYVEASELDGLSFEIAPAMLHPRYDHMLLASRDGVVFAIGGRDDEDQGLRDIEMLLPGTPSWTPYGPALFEALGDRDIVGATLLEGGLVIFVVEDGTVWRVDQNHVEQLEEWCTDAEAGCFILPPEGEPPPQGAPSASPLAPLRRSMVGLWGERVMVDGFVLPVATLGRTGADAVDLSAAAPGSSFRPPGQRVGASSVVLADGTVLGIGGRVPTSRSLANPVITRFRPLLDGPDEGTPPVSSPDAGATILHDRSGVEGGINVVAQTIVLQPDPDRSTDFASTWVHFRGFRSRRFAVEGTYEALNGTPELHVVFSRGAIARTELGIGIEGVRLLVREADGTAVEVSCADEGLNFAGVGSSVGLVVSPRAIDIQVGGEPFARCPWAGDEAVAVGLGAVGSGTLRATGLRLSRN